MSGGDGDAGGDGIIAQSMMRVTKKDILEMLKSYDDKDFVGVIFEAQDGKESPCHQVLVFFHAMENIC